MKITRETKVNNEPLLGAKVIFTKHSERNKKSVGFEYGHVSPDKVYEVVGYSHYPEDGKGPQILCDNGDVGDVPMNEMDYDIVSMPEVNTRFTPITIVLETHDDLWRVYHSGFGENLGKFLEK